MENLLSDLVDALTDQQDKFFGVVVGKVSDPVDPLFLGRVQVQLPFIDSTDVSAWARVATPMAGPAHGMYFIPNRGDEVLVAFENGDVNVPYIIGSLWNSKSKPPQPSPQAQIRMIRTPVGNTIKFTEEPPAITVMTAGGQTIEMTPEHIQILDGANVIKLTPDGITIEGPKVTINGTVAVDITAPNVTINGTAAATVQSDGICTVKAPLVKIN